MDTTAAQAGDITTQIEDSLAFIIIDNPARLNALNIAMWRKLPGIIAALDADPAIRVIVLRGQGEKAFSAGADISEFADARTPGTARDYDDLNHRAFNAVLASPKPTIAMVQGFCLGGGFELALCCDLRVAAEGSVFGIPAAKLGIGYNARWIRPLLAAMTPAAAKEILFTGERFGYNAALRMGLINRVFPPETFTTGARALALSIAENAPLSVRAAKAAIDEFARAPQTPDYAKLDAMVDACFSSDDYAEGQRAFLEKRKPKFSGR